ncbi:MAG: pilus assembly PilX N-terminal domain-containing protein [Desulforhabdus sp.]|jgi:hypothetical protein|nr:pilus assembly PilX N-terminal domain-containing protein [Desulforhabdus sp.]
MKLRDSLVKDQKGMVLLGAILIFLALSLTAIYTAYQSTIETHIAANNKSSAQAFYVSEAGIEESRVRMLSIVETGAPTILWRAFVGSAQNTAAYLPDDPYESSNQNHHLFASQQNSLQYAVRIRHKTEADYGADLNGDGSKSSSTIVLWGDADGDGIPEQNSSKGYPVERATSVGIKGDATNRITADLVRAVLDLKYAVWGNARVEINNSGTVWKGDATEPYIASIASNVHVELKSGAQIYGDVDVGKDAAGAQGSCMDNGTIFGTGPNDRDRIDPDPLGAFSTGSELDAAFIAASTSNNNALPQKIDKTGMVSPGIVDNSIDLSEGDSMTLTAGNYYLASMTLESSSSLTIDVSSGAVNIYMIGAMELKNGSTISVNPPGSAPEKITVYSKADDISGSSSSVSIKNASNFTGVIYAPRANVDVHNSGNLCGMVWTYRADVNNSGQIIYDPNLKHKFLSPRYSLISWMEETE